MRLSVVIKQNESQDSLLLIVSSLPRICVCVL